MTYDLWDVESGDIVNTFETEREALDVVRTLLDLNGPEYAQALSLGSDGDDGSMRIIACRPVTTGYKLSGSARGTIDTERVRPQLHVDREGRIVDASCTCVLFKKSQLTKGPCEHILALRLAHMHRVVGDKQKES